MYGRDLSRDPRTPRELGPGRQRSPPSPDRGPDESICESGHVCCVVLVVEGPHRSMKLPEHLPCGLPCGRSFHVHGTGVGQVEDLPATGLEAVAEIDVLAVHEVVRIEEA